MSLAPTQREADYNVGHPASLAIASDITLPEPTTFKDPSYFSAAPSLNAEEAAHFKSQGFIVKRGLIDDPAAFDQVIDHIWRNVPRDLMQRSDSQSWIGAPEDQWTEADSLQVGLLARNNWKIRSKGADGIGAESFLTERIANHPNTVQVAEALMGATPDRVRRVRGIYCVFPSKPGAENRYGPHTDYMAAHLTAMVIADDIEPRCGGFMFWPGSHVRLHPYWETVHGSAMASDNGAAFRQAREDILRDTTPIEFTGARGDVIFWHPRALHSSGVNFSAEMGKPMVRVIIPCDFQRPNRDYFDDTQFGPGEDYQWWIDTRNDTADTPPTADNMWDDWAI
jgi:hypothetical protein